MATPSYSRSLVCAAKRLRISPPTAPIAQTRCQSTQPKPLPKNLADELAAIRLPRAVQATYMQPLKRPVQTSERQATKSCDLQLRSYSVRNLEVFADFALRAAYYLNLPAAGPVPLPKLVERWTVPRSVFIFKKSMENFERKTLRRLISIKDGHPETVAIWLAFLKKYQYYGVGMKANVYEYSGIGAVKDVDAEAERVAAKLGEMLELFGGREDVMQKEGEQGLQTRVHQEAFKGQWGGMGPMGASGSVGDAAQRVELHQVSGSKR